MMRLRSSRAFALGLCAAVLFHPGVFAATPAAAITASPITGNAPLGVFFDGRNSLNAAAFLWEFGDGLSSSASNVTHVYSVAGTYTALLTVFDDQGNASAPAQVIITVNGSGQGVVTPGMNFRIAPFTSTFKINRRVKNADSFSLRGAFNTVDLPNRLQNLAITVAINGQTIVNGFLDEDNETENPGVLPVPSYFVFVNAREQLLNIDIKKANFATALGLTGATDDSIPASAPKKVPVTLTVTIGAQTYNVTQIYNYSAVKGAQGTGQFDLAKKKGDIGDGIFVISNASAIEVPDTKAHFFEFNGFIAEPTGFIPANNNLLRKPTSGNVIVGLNQADKIVIPFDRFVQKTPAALITYLQPNRQIGGVRSIVIDPVKRTFSFSTWDIKSNGDIGGTGLPTRGQAFTTFDFALRFDIDQPNGAAVSTLGVVTATRLTRKSTDDAFWQTGRKGKLQ